MKQNRCSHQQKCAVTQVQAGAHLSVQLRQYLISEDINFQSLILTASRSVILTTEKQCQYINITNQL